MALLIPTKLPSVSISAPPELPGLMDEKLGREAGSSAKLITYVTDRAGHDLRYAIDSSKLNLRRSGI